MESLTITRFLDSAEKGTIENPSEIHPETFVLCIFLVVFRFNEKGERDAKSVVNLGLYVFRFVVHPTDHYGNHGISRQCPRKLFTKV